MKSCFVFLDGPRNAGEIFATGVAECFMDQMCQSGAGTRICNRVKLRWL
jgi:hypothetical protein